MHKEKKAAGANKDLCSLTFVLLFHGCFCDNTLNEVAVIDFFFFRNLCFKIEKQLISIKMLQRSRQENRPE